MTLDTASASVEADKGGLRISQAALTATPAGPIVAETDHFRVIDDRTLVLYRAGAYVPAAHADLPQRPAALVDGVCQPAPERKRGAR